MNKIFIIINIYDNIEVIAKPGHDSIPQPKAVREADALAGVRPPHASARSSRQCWFIHDSIAKNTMSRRKLSCCFRTHSSPDCR